MSTESAIGDLPPYQIESVTTTDNTGNISNTFTIPNNAFNSPNIITTTFPNNIIPSNITFGPIKIEPIKFPYKVGDTLIYLWGETKELLCSVKRIEERWVLIDIRYPEKFAQLKRVEESDYFTKFKEPTPVQVAQLRKKLQIDTL